MITGSQVVHEKAPHIKSMMLVGPPSVGKRMLVHSICTETGANMFDLSPATVAAATSYAGKAGLTMLLHMVFKVSEGVSKEARGPDEVWMYIAGAHTCTVEVTKCSRPLLSSHVQQY